MSPPKHSNPRSAAALTLCAVVTQGKSLSKLIPASLEAIDPKQQGLYKELCYGSVRWHPQLMFLLYQLMKKPLKPKDQDLQALILIGLYQQLFTRIPSHASISETVEATNALKKKWARGLVNGVLRNFQRERDTLIEQIKENQIAHYAHPRWFLKKIQKAWPDHWQSVADANNQRPPMTLRINQQKTSVDRYRQLLEQEQIGSEACSFSSHGITLTQPCDPLTLPGFAQGLVSVQDEAPQLSADILAPAPNERILDACAAPGGKTCHLLETQPSIELVAVEKEQERSTRIQENLTRLQQQAKIIVADVAKLTDWWDGEPFDRILLDAPCSATGVIRRNPDIKLLRTKQDIEQLSTLQLQLLKAVWSTLKPGGTLLYATCSVLPQENEEVLEQFSQTTPFISQTIDAPWGIELKYGRQLLPINGQHDGFYYAKLVKPEASS
ncbi:MAG: 16S rRNA (cytosine(967)-C(5))-methyltransferase RsmB [Pseudomonadales bacterium]|nr:16S rRNA (cytosine(967)-C(5))-methyltransferase RsmB [Pseudomonadales bacterium]